MFEEKPLERLNYFNGQRLEAADLKLADEYFIRVLRWLNHSLYDPGIAEGLEVNIDPADPLSVIISPGLALDDEGWWIILVRDTRLCVPGRRSPNPEGDYLVVQYHEQPSTLQGAVCAPRRNGHKGARLAEGEPSRILAEPKFSWTTYLPHEGSGKIVLAQVQLTPDCKAIDRVHRHARRYVGVAAFAKVRQYALEGERTIDSNNSGKIVFHVRGRQPNAVTLHLRAEQFPAFFYTELGSHDHAMTVNVDPLVIDAHSHTLASGAGSTGPAGGHNHSFLDLISEATTPLGASAIALTPSDPLGVKTSQQPLRTMTQANVLLGGVVDHTHSMPSSTDSDPAKTIPLSGDGTSAKAGVTDQAFSTRGGDALNPPDSVRNPVKSLTYVRDLHILIDGKDKTDAILAQIQKAQPSVWGLSQPGSTMLGDGVKDHPLVRNGTGEIRLDFLPEIRFPSGEHTIELQAPDKDSAGKPIVPNGGRILYNLYVE